MPWLALTEREVEWVRTRKEIGDDEQRRKQDAHAETPFMGFQLFAHPFLLL